MFYLRLLVFSIFTFNIIVPCYASENNQSLIKGYISNKVYTPLKLKIFKIDKNSLLTIDRNLEDNTLTPTLNLNLVAESSSDYVLPVGDSSIFIPKSTKLLGYISEIIPAKSFNRSGFVKVSFNKAICPDGKTINLKSNFNSRSQLKVYRPLNHIGKATLGLLGGSLVGTLFSYQLGGLGLALASHGYSLASGAGAGGFIGLVGGIAARGKDASIELGDELNIVPLSDASLNELEQIVCSPLPAKNDFINPEGINLEIVSFKEKKDWSGEKLFKIAIRFTNNTNKIYKSSNLVLRDSQGKEYIATSFDFNDDYFKEFPPNETRDANLDFFVEYPKANHWLVLKDNNFTKEIGMWKVKG